MASSDVVQIVSLVLTATVSIVSLLVRARIIALESEIKDMSETLKVANVLILKQGNTIDQMSAQIVAMADTPSRKVKDEPYTTMPPYRKG